MDNEGFPAYQWSIFPEGNKEQQYVVRANSEDLLWARVDEIKKHLQEPTKPVEELHLAPDKIPACGIHQKPMVWKEGVSKTTGKPYAFWGCNDRMQDGSFCKYKP